MWSAAFTGSGGAGEADDELAPDDDTPAPRGNPYTAKMDATTICGGDCNVECFDDLKCPKEPPGKAYKAKNESKTQSTLPTNE